MNGKRMIEAPDFQLLRRYLVVDEPDEAGEWAGHCPLHEDSNASASFNFDKYVWRCFAGCQDGGMGQLIYQIENDLISSTVSAKGDRGGFTADVIDINSARKRRRNSVPLPSKGKVEGWHSALMSSSTRLRDLEVKRGISLKTVEDFLIGWDSKEEAYTLPFVVGGQLVNVKWYRIEMGTHDRKMWGVTGHNQRRIYPAMPEEDDDEVLLCEGEMDTLLARQYGFNAFTGTGGAKAWNNEWSKHFKDKTVFICYDRDHSGLVGERRVTAALKDVAKEVRVIELPYKRKKDDNHGKDLTDFWEEYGSDSFATEVKELMLRAKQVAGRPTEDDDLVDVGILDSMNIRMKDQKLRMRAQVAARTGGTQSYPKNMTVECWYDKGEKCLGCPMATTYGSSGGRGMRASLEISPNDPMILQLMEPGKNVLRDTIKSDKEFRCKDLVVEVEDYENLQVLGVTKATDDETAGRGDDLSTIRKVLVTPEFTVLPNRTLSITGRVLHNEKTKENDFLAWEVQDTETSLDRFTMTEEMHERLKVFQCDEGQRPLDKCAEIARDLSGNVTGIIGRDDLHVAFDLVWHSALRFRLDGQLLRKGWLELMVAGDTRTGKSEAAERLSQHYGLGRVISAETATRSGLVGGSQEINNEWTTTWGVIPMNDRRLVVIDEVSGLKPEEIAKMSSVRSSGIAEVIQIKVNTILSRTRLIWLGNPRSGLSMREVGDGVDVIEELLGAPEDIARLDFAMAVRSDDVSMAEINRHGRKKSKHVYTRDLCHDLVTWAWSRQPHQIVWAKGAEREVFQQAVKLSKRYTEKPPLIQGANAREKVARMSVALAARVFSTDNGENIVVTKRHVRDAVRFIDHLYGKPAFGYRDRSKQVKEREQLAERNLNTVRSDLMGDQPFYEFLNGLSGVIFWPEQLERDLNLDRSEVNAKISKYRQFGMLLSSVHHGRTGYRMSPELIELLRDMREAER